MLFASFWAAFRGRDSVRIGSGNPSAIISKKSPSGSAQGMAGPKSIVGSASPVLSLKTEKSSASELVKKLTSQPALKSKDDVVFDGLTPRGHKSSDFGITGNELSNYAVIDYGSGRVGFLVDAKVAGEKRHLVLREKLLEKSSLEVIYERVGDPILIASLNQAVNGRIDDLQSTDVGRICEQVIGDAIDKKASDVHICCREESGMVLNRGVSNELVVYRKLEVKTCQQMAGYWFSMSLPDTRSPQSFSLNADEINCVILFNYKKEPYKLRYQFFLAAGGWDLVIRILAVADDKKRTFDQLGYAQSQIKLIELAVKKSNGLVAILGPTNSGKSTALKTMMEFDPSSRFKKVYSLEDPVEYKIFLVTQISVAKRNFAEALRKLLRADPDDVMVGETRDADTAAVLADGILTGHKLYTTLHTSSAIAGYTRLNRLGLDRNVLSDRNFVSVFVFQRLLPVLCDKCKIPLLKYPGMDDYKKNLLSSKFGLDLSGIYCCNRNGCESCMNGLVASTVAAEVIVPDAGLRRFIAGGDDDGAENYYRNTRISKFNEPDMTGKTAFEHAIYKVSQGLIDPQHVESAFEPIETYEVQKLPFDEID